MKRAASLAIAAALLCIAPAPIQGLHETDESSLDTVRPGPAAGLLVVEVHEITDGSPVAGIPVELLQTGQTVLTGANGRVEFVLRPGAYDVRIYNLNQGGPPRIVTAHAIVTPRQPVLIREFNCGPCV